ncbi:MAG: hypothetical protein K2O66_03755 [Bacteroidales bacterium]|nr:hypothetical protein [Bacteroidales bacterium]MDE7072466.1 hypothetical protein [Bacteroidales bacterium]
MIGIKEKAAKVKALRSLYDEQGGGKTFSEFVEWKSKTDRDFFRWLTGNERTEDFGRNISDTARMMLLTAMI